MTQGGYDMVQKLFLDLFRRRLSQRPTAEELEQRNILVDFPFAWLLCTNISLTESFLFPWLGKWCQEMAPGKWLPGNGALISLHLATHLPHKGPGW